MYMSYCRNEGALAEVRACLDHATAHVNMEAPHEVSDREIKCFKEMILTVYDWICDMGLLEDGEMDECGLDDICESMRTGYADDE